jgi:predicted nucleotidyltransferase
METKTFVTNGPEATIQEIVGRIATRFRPLRIVLFGSRARGTAGPDSDVDLLIIMPRNGSRRAQASAIDVSLFGINLPIDVIVATPDDLAREGDRPGAFFGPALREGRVLYAEAAGGRGAG